MTKNNTVLSAEEQEEMLKVLKERFEQNSHRHTQIEWGAVQEKLEAQPHKLRILQEMERTGGEPDVVDYEEGKDTYWFFDCAAETPKGRRSVCYDREALEGRKKYKPENSALDMAEDMGIELLTEAQYRKLQQLEHVDKKTSSWLQTPGEIRKLGGAIFGDCRYEHVFIYHNGADSYYSSRGFRGALKV